METGCNKVQYLSSPFILKTSTAATLGVDNIKVITGGLPIRCVADKEMTLFADGNELGDADRNAVRI